MNTKFGSRTELLF